MPDPGYPQKYRTIRPAATKPPFHERFWWMPVATVAAACLAMTGVLAWLAYFGGAR